MNATIDDGQRRDLWRILAETQILCRLVFTKRDMVKAKAFNEAAIASAQNSGDRALLGAAIGHLAHFYLRLEKAPGKASQRLEEAQAYIQGQSILVGWFALLHASIAAHQGKQQACEKHTLTALDVAYQVTHTDAYFTDFGTTSVNVFAGNSLLTVGESHKAYQWLTQAKIEDLSPNRHASAYYDIARAYAVSDQLEAAQAYAFKSIDRAIATDNFYIIPRFARLAETIQRKYPGDPHASTIVEYALNALHTQKEA